MTISRNASHIKRKIREYYKQLYVHKFDNLDITGKFHKKHKLWKFIQDEIT